MKRAPSPRAKPGPLPAGWEVIRAQDGTCRIRPHHRSNLIAGLLLVAAGLGCCGFAGLLFVVLSRSGGWRGLRLTMLLPLGLLLIGQGVRLAFGREEWLMGADRLEVRRRLLGLGRSRRFRGATLRLIEGSSRSTSRTQRRLLRAARSGRRIHDSTPAWAQLYVSDRQATRCLASSSTDAARPAELRALGELLSEHTGWPLLLPARRVR